MTRLIQSFAAFGLCWAYSANVIFADLNDLLRPVPGASKTRESVRNRKEGEGTPPSDSARQTGEKASPQGAPMHKVGVDGLKELTEADLVDSVQKDLLRRFPSLGDLKVQLSRPWKPLPLPVPEFFVECLQLPGGGLSTQMTFTVRVVSGGRILGEFPLQTRTELWQEVWVSSQRLDKGQLLERGMLNSTRLDVLREFVPPLTVDHDYVGFELSQPLQAGRPLTRRDIVEKTVVKRGQLVEAVASEGPLKIRMRAQALEGGPAGAVIRVKNVDSQKEFVAQILNENQVQVRF